MVTHVFDESNLSQEIFAIDTWRAIICSLRHGRKHMLTILSTIYRDQALFKPGLHISRKDRKHRLENIVNIYLSQEIFATDMLRALKSSLKHRRKRSLQLYGDQALVTSKKPFAFSKACKRWKTKSGSCIIFFFRADN